MSRGNDVQTVIRGLVVVLILLAVSLVIDIIVFATAASDRTLDPEVIDAAGIATTSVVMLAVIGVLASFVKGNRDD